MINLTQLAWVLCFGLICWVAGYITGEGQALIDEKKKKEVASIKEKE